MAQPNFVFVLTDQQRRDSLGCYGNQVAETPHLDTLAAESIVFDRLFTANVVCAPSRASIMTGRYPSCHGVVTNGVQLSQREITLPAALAENGYRTAAAGKIHLAPHGNPDPKRYPVPSGNYESPESVAYWQSGRSLPMPYYGFQQVRMCAGHGYDWTDYYRHLFTRDPRLLELFKLENALTPPTGAPGSWKSALPEEHHSTTWVADEAIKMLQEFSQRSDPFFLFVGFPDPHAPYCPPAPWCDMYDPADVPMPNRHRDEIQQGSSYYRRRHKQYAEAFGFQPVDMPDPYIREIIAHTYGMVSLLDKHIGRIIDAVNSLGLRENTVIIFTTDHGEHLGDHWFIYKVVEYDELMRLPSIFSWPTQFRPPGRYDGIVSHIDLMPTVLDLAGIELPHGVQGISFRPALEGGKFTGRPCALIEDDNADQVNFASTIWTPEYRLTYRLPDAEGDLFDLGNDPNELVNRWHDPSYRSVRNEHVELLLRANIESSDPKPVRFTSA